MNDHFQAMERYICEIEKNVEEIKQVTRKQKSQGLQENQEISKIAKVIRDLSDKIVLLTDPAEKADREVNIYFKGSSR